MAVESEKSDIPDSGSGVEKVQDENEAYCYPRKKEDHKMDGDMSKGPLEGDR